LPASRPTEKTIVEQFFSKGAISSEGTITVYEGKGCSACGGIGYKGRIAIFEFVQMTPEMRDLILKVPSTQQIWQMAMQQGSTTMFADGIEKVENGITSLSELLRVVEPQSKRS